MLLNDGIRVNLDKSYQKVLNVFPAYNDTYCFLGMRGHRQDCVVHYDKNGKILFQHVFPKAMDAFGMLSDRQCILLETRQNCITILDLEKHQFKKIPFQFLNEETDQSWIHTFSDTKFLCIRENGRYNDPRFKLSYFHYPLEKDAKPFKIFYSQDTWTHQYLVRKANNHSQICWFKGRHDDNWEFFVYSLREDPQGKLQKYTFPNTVGKPYGMDKVQCALKTMWEMRPFEYVLVCDTNRAKGQNDIINNNYIVDVRTGNFRQMKATFGKYQQLLIDQKYMGSTSAWRAFDFQDGKPLQTPVYYVDNDTQEIIAEESWQCSYLYKYEFPGYDGNMIAQSQFENGDVKWIHCQAKKIVNPKEVYMHFLLTMNPDFDPDLLQTVVEMIDYSK